ncbi:sporulation integral membrane protein YlbJ [Alteribacillus sp. HJP-4]|uniref:sporulation integral membrane protein YlbJ n=1 Tax=Alteribacillus sp. HJP-4 TaxID=2775394 RepID=UPI0035CCDC1A
MSGMVIFLFFFAICLISYPQHIVEASRNGLNMWLEVVFPSLLPFFITAELFIAFGIVHFFGILLEPLMRPLFNVPGCGGFVWAMGLASGFPSGAKFTAELRKKNKLTKEEAERLVSFTNSSNPLFICGAVAVGFFHNAELGILLAIVHYLSNLIVGLCMRFYKINARPTEPMRYSYSLSGAFQELLKEQQSDTRPFGKKLGDAVTRSIQTLLMIGGFIILFSVLYEVLHLTNMIDVLALLPGLLLSTFHYPAELAWPWVSGLFEITVGSKLVADLNTDLFEQAVIVGFILGFSGFSVHAQVASLLAETDIRFTPFFFARILHGCLAVVLTFLLWKPLYAARTEMPAFQQNEELIHLSEKFLLTSLELFKTFGPFFTISCFLLYACFSCYFYFKNKKARFN